MRSRPTQSLPPPLQAARRSFERWRSQRKARSRIPESLWRTAVKLAVEFGVHRTAKALRLNHAALKTQVTAAQPGPSTGASPTQFVELVPGMLPGAGKCVVEFDDGHGARLCVHLEDADATVLSALASALVRGAR